MRAVASVSGGGIALTLSAAQRAQDLGLPMLAAELYRQARDVPGADRAALTLSLATALLDAGDAAQAEKELAQIPEPRGAMWHLRAGLAAVQLKKMDAARAELAAIVEDEVPVADYPWYWFFQGELVELAPVRDISRANNFYVRAEQNATTELSKARFQLSAERVRLLAGTVDPRNLLENYERHQGTRIGYDYAQYHATALDAQGKKSEAVAFLQRVIKPLQRQEAEWWDKMRLVLGMIGDKGLNGPGRTALNQLVENGHSPERQRQALQMLASASAGGPERKQFQDSLRRWIDAKPNHPIKESLLFFRAQFALAEKEFVQAESDANALLTQFPKSPLRMHAYGVLTQSAWEQRRFRQAAGFADKARAELPVDNGGSVPVAQLAHTRAEFGVMIAEAWFRAGLLAAGDQNDFRLAADAYAAVLRERPAELDRAKLGALMFQRVLAEIKSRSGRASKVLDEMAADPAFDLENRWQAEWSLARSLQLRGEAGVKEAFERVDHLLRQPAEGEANLKPELRARFKWLHARLAFDNGDAELSIRLADAALSEPLEIGVELKTEIASTLILLKARAEFALGREAAAFETLKRLRAEYLKTDAAISSYMIESEYYAAQDKIEEARKRLISLTDNQDYKDSEYIPLALFRLALLSERLGREENLQEANKRIEELVKLVNSRPGPGESDLIFAARL
jgi:hypothetical protein